MNLVMMTEGTGQGVHGRKTNVGRLYDLLAENRNQRINLEAGPGTHAFRHLGGTFFGTDAMSIDYDFRLRLQDPRFLPRADQRLGPLGSGEKSAEGHQTPFAL